MQGLDLLNCDVVGSCQLRQPELLVDFMLPGACICLVQHNNVVFMHAMRKVASSHSSAKHDENIS